MRPTLEVEKKIHPSLGKCIYCGVSREDYGADFTDEHIIPFFLNGRSIIRKAACEICREKSNSYESVSSNTDFLVPRLLLAMKRRKKSIPRYLPKISYERLGDDSTPEDYNVQVEASKYPPLFKMLLFPPPRTGVTGDITSLRIDIISLDRPYGFNWHLLTPTGYISAREPMSPFAFAMSLAKIAYCFAVAEIGIENFNGQDMRDLLLGKREDVLNFVGNIIEEKSKHKTPYSLHKLSTYVHSEKLYVRVWLFSSYGTTPYEVIVGDVLKTSKISR